MGELKSGRMVHLEDIVTEEDGILEWIFLQIGSDPDG